MMYEDPLAARRRKILLAIVIAIVGLVVYFVVLQFSRQNEVPVRINVLPENAEITVNDSDSFKGSGTAYLSPGTYKVKLSAEGFKTSEDAIVVEKESVTEYYILSTNSLKAEQWQKDNQQKILEFEGKTAEQATKNAERFQQKNKVTSVLPYRNVLYSIEYRADNSGGVVLQILADTPEYRRFALDKLREFGHEPTDLKIEFMAPFANAFEEGEDDESEHND